MLTRKLLMLKIVLYRGLAAKLGPTTGEKKPGFRRTKIFGNTPGTNK